MGYVVPWYPRFAVFLVLVPRGIVVFSLLLELINKT
jgi:hypothetical protein